MCNSYRNLLQALEEFEPHIVVYNAGTDILDGDPLGVLSISEDVWFFYTLLCHCWFPTDKLRQTCDLSYCERFSYNIHSGMIPCSDNVTSDPPHHWLLRDDVIDLELFLPARDDAVWSYGVTECATCFPICSSDERSAHSLLQRNCTIILLHSLSVDQKLVAQY